MLKVLKRGYSCAAAEAALITLKERGLIKHVTRISSALPPRDCTVYCGFDPTASSLHIGHLVTIISLLHCRQAGLKPIAVVGGATGRVGDPSGRVHEREEMKEEKISTNTASIIQSLQQIFHNDEIIRGAKGPEPCVIDNWSWWRDIGAIQFASDIVRPFRLSSMIAKESVSQRMASEDGMNCTEFLYPCFQAYDYLHLHTHHNCWIQVGGSDQWGNITSGCEYVRKKCGDIVHGLTVPLLTTSSGEKLGKSVGNAVWLSDSSYQLYQAMLQVSDQDVASLLTYLTFIPLQDINHIMDQHILSPEKYLAQKTLAEEVTRLVHGEDGVCNAMTATKALFGDHQSLHSLTSQQLIDLFSRVPTSTLNFDLLLDEPTVGSIAVQAAVIPSQFELSRLLATGGLYINGQRVTEGETFHQSIHMLPGNLTVFRIGKKKHHLLHWT